MFTDLSNALNQRGWDVARYGKYGAYKDKINPEEYKKTDMKIIIQQLQDVWKRLPRE